MTPQTGRYVPTSDEWQVVARHRAERGRGDPAVTPVGSLDLTPDDLEALARHWAQRYWEYAMWTFYTSVCEGRARAYARDRLLAVRDAAGSGVAAAAFEEARERAKARAGADDWAVFVCGTDAEQNEIWRRTHDDHFSLAQEEELQELAEAERRWPAVREQMDALRRGEGAGTAPGGPAPPTPEEEYEAWAAANVDPAAGVPPTPAEEYAAWAAANVFPD